MSEKFQNRFRNESARMPNWNYNEGLYFVTVNTKDRMSYFGKISDGEMSLSEIGKIAESEWLKTPSIRPDMNIILDEFVVMPDHFHGIIGFNDVNRCFHRRDAMHRVPTIETNKFGPQSKNLASIIRGFKSSVTTAARKKGLPFDWQPRFHEHAIRDEMELRRIVKYIRDNPANG